MAELAQSFDFTGSSGTDVTDATKWKELKAPQGPGVLAAFGVSFTGDPGTVTGTLALALVSGTTVLAVLEGTLTKTSMLLRSVPAGGSGGYMVRLEAPGGSHIFDLAGGAIAGRHTRWLVGVGLPGGSSAAHVEADFPVAFKQ